MGVIFSDSFDATVAPAMPAAWLSSTGYATSTTQFRSPPNSLSFTGSGTIANTFRTGARDGKNGNVELEAWVRVDAPGTSSLAQLILRSSVNTTVGSYNAYRVMISIGTGVTTSLSIIRRNASTDTTLGSRSAASVAFAPGDWYQLLFRAETLPSSVRLRLWVRRGSDGYWLDAVPAWGVSKEPTLSIEDSSASRVTGEGYIGLRCQAQTGAVVYVDDLVLRDLSALPPIVSGMGSSLIRPAWSPGGFVPLIRG
jgi:hypothetical protein